MAELKSPLQRINSVNSIDPSTKIHLRPSITDFEDNERSYVVLKTRYKSIPQANIINDQKRSLFTIDDLKSSGLEPQLIERIEQVINNKWLSKNNFKKTGLDNFYIIGNFLHKTNSQNNSNFFIAIIPKYALIDNIYLQLEWFKSSSGGRSHIRFTLNTEIVLIPQWDDSYSPILLSEQGKSNITYSLLTAKVEGGRTESSSLGLTSEYANVLQISSTVLHTNHQMTLSNIEQYKIHNLTQSQKKSILNQSLTIANELQESTIYNTVFNGAITHTVLALRGDFDSKTQTHQGLAQLNPSWFNPYTLVNRMTEVGIKMEQHQSLNYEFKNTINHQTTYKTERKTTNTDHSLMDNQKLEDLIRKVAFFLSDHGMKGSQANELFSLSTKQLMRVLKNKKSRLNSNKLMSLILNYQKVHFPETSIEDLMAGIKSVLNQQPI